jgi:hypothetical protein
MCCNHFVPFNRSWWYSLASFFKGMIEIEANITEAININTIIEKENPIRNESIAILDF